MIFQTELTSLDSELSQLEALLNAKRQQRNVYNQLQQQTEGYLEGLAKLKQQISEAVGTNALASLKSAVLGLFGTDDDGTDGGNQPSDPSPQPIEPLSGQTCQIDKELEFYWQRKALPEGQAWEFATPIACLLWEDAPLLGQAYQLCSLLEDKPADIPQSTPSSTELVHTSARTGYLKIRSNGQILAGYAWFSRKDTAEAWFEHFDMMSIGNPELRLSKRNSSFKYEIKLTELNMRQIECLAKEELHKKPAKAKETPAQAAGIEPPSGWGKPQQPDPMTCILGEGDVVEVMSHRHPAHHGLIGTVEALANFSELPLQVKTPRGTKGYQRSELKLISKREKLFEKAPESGRVMLGGRIETSGNYTGLARRNAINNARNGLEDKLAAMELVRSGVSPDEAMAAVTGSTTATATNNYDF
jgi:hypothetical protein